MRNEKIQVFTEHGISEVALVQYACLCSRFFAEGKDFVCNLETPSFFPHKSVSLNSIPKIIIKKRMTPNLIFQISLAKPVPRFV